MSGAENTPAAYGRIISMAPSITEVLFALGQGGRIIGVTRFCDYPDEARGKKKVGGYIDPNYEAIVVLKPDLVIILPEHVEAERHLAKLGLRTLKVNHRNISGIMESIITIGDVCDARGKAGEMVKDLKTRMDLVKSRTDGLRRPRVMISVGRNMGTGSLKDIYISGKDDFYDEMIMLAGGSNVYDGRTVMIPIVSSEGVLLLNPDVIIDMVPDLEEKGWDKETVLKEWEGLSGVKAIRNNRVYIFGHDYVSTPGPRFILILEKMARVIHPEAKWE